jgi:hypothetical protein
MDLSSSNTPKEVAVAEVKSSYPLSLSIDYPEKLDRLTSFFRILWIIPIAIILSLLIGSFGSYTTTGHSSFWGYHPTLTMERGWRMEFSVGLIFLPLVLMVLFRQKYPRWWFDWNLALLRFSTRVEAYFGLLRDEYPSTDEEQAVHLDMVYPDAKQELNRWLPLVKWFLAIPHYFLLFFLGIAAAVCLVVAWFAILFTGRYPRGLFDFVVGYMRWCLRVLAYAFMLVTDRYPPFSLD